MILDPTEIGRLLPFEERYERRRLRWYDGPHGSWEAFDRVLEREVVLNIPWAYSNVPRFIRSAKIAASFRHPGFLPVLDLGLIEGKTPYYTTPPVREGPLGHLLRELEREESVPRVEFPILSLVGAVRDTCRALDHALQRGLLHLDLQPDSLLVGKDYHVILDPTGLNWFQVGSGGGLLAAWIVGCPAYMSPEQVHMSGTGIGPATDVFGLGGILHFILFGTPPNHLPGGSAVQVLGAIVGRVFEPRRPGTLRPGIRSSSARRRVDRLVNICLKAIAHEPETRYPTAADLGDALDDWLRSGHRSWWERFRQI